MSENDFKKLKQILTHVTAVIESKDLEWSDKFNQIFSAHVVGAVLKIDSDFVWYDPDTSHQEDCLAFYNALTARVAKWETLF